MNEKYLEIRKNLMILMKVDNIYVKIVLEMRIFLFTLIRTFVCQEPTLFLCYSTCGTLQTDLCFLCSEQFSDGLLYPFQKIIPVPSTTLRDNLPEIPSQSQLTMNPTVVDKLQT